MFVQLKVSQFSWNGEQRTLTADISDLQIDGFPNQMLLATEKSSSKFMFEAIKTKKNKDGDIELVEYAPIQTQSALADIRITIYND